MYLTMAVGASGKEEAFHFNGFRLTCSSIYSMALMTLKAQKRLPHDKEVIIWRTVRSVAIEAVLRQIGMFVKEGSFLLPMAACANLFNCGLPQELFRCCAVRVMTVSTIDLTLRYWMMARHLKVGHYVLMTLKTHGGCIFWFYLQVRAFVYPVTV